MTQTTPTMSEGTTRRLTLYCSIELSAKSWKLAFSPGDLRVRYRSVECGAIDDVIKEFEAAARRFGLPAGTRWLSCYEAGRDGFWVHRALVKRGVQNLVIDPSSLEVDQRWRRAKTDRLDAERMVRALIRNDRERGSIRTVRVPTPEVEDARRPERERERLVREATAHKTRIHSLLALHGITLKKQMTSKLKPHLANWHGPSGDCLPAGIRSEIGREFDRLELVEKQLALLKEEREGALNCGPHAQKVASLMLIRGIGNVTALLLVKELFGWRDFKNRRQVGAFVGLTPTPHDSGFGEREQGISKAGSRRLRALSIELAWNWLRFQPDSQLSRWFSDRFASGKRVRRIGIVALARKILVALWRYLERGTMPDGVLMKAET